MYGIALPALVTTARDATLTTAVGGRLYRTCSGDPSADDGVVCMCVSHANESSLSTNERGGDEGWWWAPRKQAVLTVANRPG